MSELYNRYIVESLLIRIQHNLETIGLPTWHFLGEYYLKNIYDKANDNGIASARFKL